MNQLKIDHRKRCTTAKVLEDNIGGNLGDLGFGDRILDTKLNT